MIPNHRLVIDTETGGTHRPSSALLSIGAAFCTSDFTVIDTFIGYCRPHPKTFVVAESIAINGYSPEAWEANGAVSEAVLLQKFATYCRSRRHADWCAYNADFDKEILEHAAGRNPQYFDCSMPRVWTCLLQRAKQWGELFGYEGSHRLDQMAIHAGHWTRERQGFHHAQDDALAAAAVGHWLHELLSGLVKQAG